MRGYHEATSADRVRWGLRIRGTVQGVGFRPTVYRVARALGLGGLVRNDGEGVWIEVEGAPAPLARFVAALRAAAPPLAHIDAVERTALPPVGGDGFAIVPSLAATAAQARIPADVAPCADCLRELADARDRRHRYPFINCTACGPRYTLIEELPYDRARTTMRAFSLCAACAAEYGDPSDRRFHAEPNACPACGPRLDFHAPGVAPAAGEAALRAAVARLAAGQIVAVRGVGGFLLAVDARDEAAVAELRRRKHRPHKPLALMARDLDEAARIVRLDDAARRTLEDPARPIVLLPARPDAGVAPSVAPGLGEYGVMLPSTPLHQLVLGDGPPLLVMTSGNRADEPLAIDDAEAQRQLGDIADAFLTHDRPIHTRVDDSVVRLVAGARQPVRRARGLVPAPIALPFADEPLVAVGAELKSTVCLVRPGEAFVSQHLGDLGHPATLALFEETLAKLARLYAVTPAAVAHDLHPDYRSTRWALASGLPRVPVQHHHAHLAACLAEHGRTRPAIGVAFDGTGCGPAGELWGGEILVADLGGFRRVGHLRGLPLPGGEAAIRAPWRLAAAALLDAGEPLTRLSRVAPAQLAAVRRLVDAAPVATSAGRWFDAVAALAAVRDEITYEGQAAVELEAIAAAGPADPYPFALEPSLAIDLRPTVRAIVRAGEPAPVVAARFHETMAQVVLAACRCARVAARLDTVALSGGCFQNVRLTERCLQLLGGAGFEVLIHRRVPPNDGGVSLGQAAVAAFRRAQTRRTDVPRHPR